MGSFPGLDGLRVLVVEDEIDTRELIATVLAKCGAKVRTCGTAAEALEQFREWSPDLLVSDIGLPGEDGYSLIKKVRTLNEHRGQVPALALTAYASLEDRARVLAAGFQMHLAKPVDPEELVAIVADLVGEQKQETEGKAEVSSQNPEARIKG
jgi:CheY-like chemotaxis protein